MLRFEWDEKKSRLNRSKHGVTFEEAQTIFMDDNALFLPDPDDRQTEERFLLLGTSQKLRVLVVCHCFRQDEEVIRIISARKATSREKRVYEERRHA